MSELYQGDLAPKAYQQIVHQGDSGLDLTMVSAAVFKVLKPSGVEVTWAAVLSAASALSLTLTYPLAALATDCDVSGDYIIYALLTVPGGVASCTRVRKYVRGKYETP